MNLVGIDIGGTNVRMALLDETGRVAAQSSAPTFAERGAAAAIALMIDRVRELLAGAPLDALGIGITGPVDPVTAIVSNPYTLAGWPPTDMRAPFAEVFAVPVAVDNDANVAAVGEWWMGAGRGSRRLAVVTVGTGIGVATLIEGQIQRAVDGRHGEAGHIVIDASGPECYCGANGCWEALASGTALGRAARERASQGGGLWALAGGEVDRIDSLILFRAAAEDDPTATELVGEAARWIGLGLVNLAATFMPDRFLIAGGLAEHLPVLRPGIEAVLRRHSVMVPGDVPVAAAALGDDAGPIGAARLALAAAGLADSGQTKPFPAGTASS